MDEFELKQRWGELEKREEQVSEWVVHASTLYHALKDDYLFDVNNDDLLRAGLARNEFTTLEHLLSNAYGFDSVLAVIGTLNSTLNIYDVPFDKLPLRGTYRAKKIQLKEKKRIMKQYGMNNRGGAYQNLLALELFRIDCDGPTHMSAVALIPLPGKRYAAVQLKKDPTCRMIYTKSYNWLTEKQKVLGKCDNVDLNRLKRMLSTFYRPLINQQRRWLKELEKARRKY